MDARMTINAKLRLAFLLVALLLLGSTAVQRWMTAHILIDKQLDQLETAAEIQKQQIDALVKNSEERLALVASRTRLRAKLNDYVEGVGAPEDTRAGDHHSQPSSFSKRGRARMRYETPS